MECDSNPCQNAGNCTDMLNMYSCSCALGFTGVHCETGSGPLTHWGWVTHICVDKLTIDPDNGLSPDRRQAIIGLNAEILLIGLFGRNKFQWNLYRNSYIFIQQNVLQNVVWEMSAILYRPLCVNALKPRQNGRHFATNLFKYIFWYESCCLNKNSTKFVVMGSMKNTPVLVRTVVWRRAGGKPLSESMIA